MPETNFNNPELHQPTPELEQAAPRLNQKFRQDLANRNQFGMKYKLETIKAALWSFIHENAAGYDKKFSKEYHQLNRTLIINQDMAMSLAGGITSKIDIEKFRVAGKSNSEEGEEEQLQLIAQAIADYLDYREEELGNIKPDDRRYKYIVKDMEIIKKLIK